MNRAERKERFVGCAGKPSDVKADVLIARIAGVPMFFPIIGKNMDLGIARDGKLGGAMNVELKSSAAVVRMPLAIGGTAKAPQLTQSRGR